jgi:hypothetical protein
MFEQFQYNTRLEHLSVELENLLMEDKIQMEKRTNLILMEINDRTEQALIEVRHHIASLVNN